MNLCGITFYRTSANGARKIAKFKPPGRGRGEYSGIITRHKKERRRRFEHWGEGARCRVPFPYRHNKRPHPGTGAAHDRRPRQLTKTARSLVIIAHGRAERKRVFYDTTGRNHRNSRQLGNYIARDHPHGPAERERQAELRLPDLRPREPRRRVDDQPAEPKARRP